MPPDTQEPFVLVWFFELEENTSNNKIIAPDNNLIDVNDAGSMAVSFKANLHKTELAAKAIIASVVKRSVLVKNLKFIILSKF